jgi:hypothetical protein
MATNLPKWLVRIVGERVAEKVDRRMVFVFIVDTVFDWRCRHFVTTFHGIVVEWCFFVTF